MNIFKVLLFCIFIGAIVQCTTRNEEELKEICFETEIMPIITSNCASPGCHDDQSQADGVNLSTYEGIMREVKAGKPFDSELIEVITANELDKRMPPPPTSPLSQENIDLLIQWIEKGAANTTNCGESSCDTVAVSFSQDIVPIMNTNCVSCHNGPSGNGGVNLANYQGVRQAIENRGLIATINHEAGIYNMPPSMKMSDCNIQKIEAWVAQGMPNN